MPVGRDNPANTAMVEWKSTKMLGDQDNRIALILIRTEGARWHNAIGLHA